MADLLEEIQACFPGELSHHEIRIRALQRWPWTVAMYVCVLVADHLLAAGWSLDCRL